MRSTTLSVSDNVIMFDTPIITYRTLYNRIKITLDTGKLSDNVLIDRLDEDGDPKFSTYVTVLPSGGIKEAFGDATTFEQRNQFKKGIKAVKQHKQAIIQKMKSLWSNKKM